MTIDAGDHLYICAWGASAVYRVEARTGRLVATIEVPGVKNITSCAFGGPTLRDLYITTSADQAKMEEEPNAGALFRITLSDAQGTRASVFQA
jgi:sugar lactone lactonase YvrE